MINFQQSGRRLPLLCFLGLLVANGVFAQIEQSEWSRPINLLSLNTAADDFAPSWSPDGRLFFNSDVSGYSLFYRAAYQGGMQFAGPELIEGELNNMRANHQSFIAFAASGEIYFCTYRQTASRPFMNIFAIARQGEFWGRPGLVPAINLDSFSAHPSFSPSGRQLVFASDRQPSQGGTDLWFTSRRGNGAWSEPINLGPRLNSDGNEITPFFAADDSLFFASDGFGGQGGYEIFLALRDGGAWQAPVPVVELNSAGDDSDLTLLPDGLALFSSNRAGGKGGLDLYAARFTARTSAGAPAVRYSVSANYQAIKIEEIAVNVSFDLLPYIFFDQAAADISDDLNSLDADAAGSFRPGAIRATAESVYRNTLNIIGSRMQAYPGASLTLTGCADMRSDGESKDLGLQRARRLRSYLQDVWNIAEERIVVTGRGLPEFPSNSELAEGRAENRRVEISSADRRILAPLRLANKSSEVAQGALVFGLDARPRDIVQHWTLEVSSGARVELLRRQGDSLPVRIPLPSVATAIDSLGSSVTVRLNGVDTLDRPGGSAITLPVNRVRSTVSDVLDSLGRKRLERYQLPPFSYDQSHLNAEQERMIADIAGSILADDRVLVVGFTDILGSDIRNERLANDRAVTVSQHLQELLPAVDVLIEARSGSKLFDNSTPFGRFFSRTVHIVVEKVAGG